jgi:hypothetical protein
MVGVAKLAGIHPVSQLFDRSDRHIVRGSWFLGSHESWMGTVNWRLLG